MVTMLIGCGLRRAELLALNLESIQQREEHWVIADLVGQRRTCPNCADSYVGEERRRRVDGGGGHHRRPSLRAINKAGHVWGNGMSPKVVWDVVRAGGGSRRD